jgi:hypothetical protein
MRLLPIEAETGPKSDNAVNCAAAGMRSIVHEAIRMTAA